MSTTPASEHQVNVRQMINVLPLLLGPYEPPSRHHALATGHHAAAILKEFYDGELDSGFATPVDVVLCAIYALSCHLERSPDGDDVVDGNACAWAIGDLVTQLVNTIIPQEVAP